MCWKNTSPTGKMAARKKRRRGSDQARLEGSSTGPPGSVSAWPRWTGARRRARTSRIPAAIEVVPFTRKSERKETVARKPPSAGPTLIPRLIASRVRANAGLRCAGRTRSATTARLAGRNASAASDSASVIPMTDACVRANGKRSRMPPLANSESRITCIGPSTSERRPESAAETRAPAP